MNKTRTAVGVSSIMPARKTPEIAVLNKDIFETKWKQIRSLSTGWWSLVTEAELDKIAKADVKYDKYVTTLQVKYGYTRDQARKELSRRVTESEGS